MGSLPLMKRGALHRPSSQNDCGIQCRSEPRTGRRCLEDQTADSGFLESHKEPQKQAHIDYQAHLKVKSQNIEGKDIK